MTQLLTIEEAASELNVSVATLRYWRVNGRGPRSARLGRRVMYRQSDLEQWVADRFADARTRTPAA